MSRINSKVKARKLARLVERDGTQCFWCHEEMSFEARFHDPGNPLCATFDHLIPRSRGGGNDDDNLVLACRECNSARADMTYMPAVERELERAA